MADVIRLEGRTSRAPRKSLPDPGRDNKAVILLFTGIRYERLDGLDGKASTKPHLQSTNKTH